MLDFQLRSLPYKYDGCIIEYNWGNNEGSIILRIPLSLGI